MPSLEATLDEARPFLRDLTMQAGEVVMRHFRQPLDMKRKVGTDIVTEADFESEALVANAIRDRFPDHALIAEEGSRGAPKSDYCWYIDPLDGTVNFAAGIPLFAVAICLTYRGEPALGALLDPVRNQLYWAEQGQGANVNGEPLQVSDHRELANSVIYLSSFGLRRPHLAPAVLATMQDLGTRTRSLVHLGSAGIAWAYVASGYIDGDISFAVDQFTGPAGVLLVREAGGTVTDFEGNYWKPGTKTVVATNGHIHEPLQAIIHRPDEEIA